LVKVQQSAAQLAVPVWMLDPIFCAQLQHESHPRLSLSALIELRELLDGQPTLHPPANAISRGASRGGGGDDAPQDVGHHSAADAAIRTP
jgi:hypothetical protein